MQSEKDRGDTGNWLAVVVIYRQQLAASKTLLSLARSLERCNRRLDVLVYDNSPQPQAPAPDTAFARFNITYHHDASNPGVSKAYNTGAELAGQRGKKWLLLLDQDTEFPAEAISTYLAGPEQYPGEVLFVPLLQSPRGIYSPSRYFFKRGSLWKEAAPGLHSLENKTILNSGTFVSLDAYKRVGGYKESVKLYFSDFYFIDQLRKHYKSFVVLDMVCQHELSDISSTDLPTSLRRFNYYCEGAVNAAGSVKDWFPLFITVGLRAGLLSWRFKNLRFAGIFLKRFLKLAD